MNAARSRFHHAGKVLLLCAAASGLCACMGAPGVELYGSEPIEAGSTASAQIAERAAQDRPWPRFAEIPQLPADVRTPEAWRAAVAGTEQDRVQLLAAVAPSTWSLIETEAFAARITSSLALKPGDVPTAAQQAETEAWARRMRERATPPPRPRR